MAVRVYLDTKSYVTIRVKPTMTIRELGNQVAALLHITENGRFFCIYEGVDEANETVIDEETQVLDRLAIWQHRFEYNKRNGIREGRYRFTYHARLFFDIDKTNKPLLGIMFVQALHDMRIGHYPCTQMDLITLLALSTKAYFGDKELTDEELESEWGERMTGRRFICENTPEEARAPKDLLVMREKVKEFCKKLKGKGCEWYICAYMEYVMSWELYGVVMFPVEVGLRGSFHRSPWEGATWGRTASWRSVCTACLLWTVRRAAFFGRSRSTRSRPGPTRQTPLC